MCAKPEYRIQAGGGPVCSVVRPACMALIVLQLCMSACVNDGSRADREKTIQTNQSDSGQIAAAQKWLVSSIEAHFSNQIEADFAYLCTPQYAEFKRDATNVDLDPGMSEAAFRKKWGRRCGPYAGIGEGFMVAGTDHGKIRVRSCQYSHKTEMGHYLFKTILEDLDFGSVFYRDISVKQHRKAFRIDDVLEKRNAFALP